MKKPSLTAPVIALLGASFFMASVAGQPTQFETSGKSIDSVTYAYEVTDQGESFKDVTLWVNRFLYYPFKDSYACSVESTFYQALCNKNLGGIHTTHRELRMGEQSRGTELSCAVVVNNGQDYLLNVVESSESHRREHSVTVRCGTAERCRLTDYAGSQTSLTRHGTITTRYQWHSIEEVKKNRYGVPLNCRGETTWIGATDLMR